MTKSEIVPWESLTLLQAVREVAALAKPAEPQAVSQRLFDETREQSAAHAGLPRAKRIAEQLELPWADVLAVALEPEERQNHLLGLKKPDEVADWLTEDGVRSALRGAALRLGQETVSELDYRVDRKKIAAADQRRWRHGGQLRMPSYKQIRRKAGSWSAALRIAGLKTARELGPKHANAPGRSPRKHKWEKNECAAWAQRCLEESPRMSKGVSSDDYLDWRSQYPSAPNLKSFRQYGGWRGVRKLAQERINAGLPPA